jgi:hypothetical protein
MQYQLTGLSSGLTYKIAILAYNSEGPSDLSEYVVIAAGSLPTAPTTILKGLSTSSTISVTWDKVADADLPITGYLLEMADFGSYDFKAIYKGANHPATRSFAATNLTSGLKYSFRVSALNFNGISEPSDVFVFNACTAPPSMATPFRIDQGSTTNNLVIGW